MLAKPSLCLRRTYRLFPGVFLNSGLMVDALDGQPGIYSARYGSSDADRISRLLKELESEQNRQAQFVCAIAIARPDGTIALQVEGICRGEILHTPRGTAGFGYDPIFYVPAQQQTFAEMTAEIKRSHSHRGRAFQALMIVLPGGICRVCTSVRSTFL
jgi:non-canonical purine NTP pyrophosphatase, rdgB/HAM1 family